MNLTRKYSLVGALWGLVLAYGAVAVATGLGVAILFGVVYGDRPWADNTTAILYGLGLLAVAGSTVVCTAAGYAYGRRADALQETDRVSEHRRAHILIGAAMLAALMGGYQLNAQNAALANRQALLDQMLGQRHEISALHVRERADHRGLDIVVDAHGQRQGRYVLELRILDGKGNAIHEQREALDVPAHEIHHLISVDYPGVMQGVLEHTDRRQPTVTHRDTLTVRARLTPILERRELRALPSHAATHYDAPDSPFHSDSSLTHLLEFHAENGQYWIATRGEWHRVQH